MPFFLFSFSTKEPCQLKSNPLIEECITHYAPNRAKINYGKKNACFCKMKENMITCFFFYFALKESIMNTPTPPFELILSQNLGQVISSKETNSCKNPRIPNYIIRVRIRVRLRSPTCQGGVKRLN